MILTLFFVYFSSLENLPANDLIQFPNSKSLASYALKLVKEGKIKDHDYTFSENDLYIGRVDHVFDLKDESLTIQYNMSVRCHITYKPEESSQHQMYYLTTSIDLDINGNITEVYPSLSFDACSEYRDGLNNNHVKTIPDVSFSPEFELLKHQSGIIAQVTKQLIKDKKVSIYNHTFNLNEIDIKSISLVEYVEPEIKKVVIKLIPTCDVLLELFEDHTAILSELYIYLLPDQTVDKVHATYIEGTEDTCNNKNQVTSTNDLT